MRLRSLLATAALTATMGIGSIAMMAPSASAATHGGDQNFCQQRDCGQQPKCNENWGFGNSNRFDNCGICHPVLTPPELNRTWVENTTGETVTVTLSGKYYWVELNDHPGDYPKGNVITLLPGESISVAWYWNTGPHSWCWTGQEICTTAVNPCPCNTDPCGHITFGNTLEGYNGNRQCDPQPPCGIRPLDDLHGIQNCLPCFPVVTRTTIPCFPKGGMGDGGNGRGPSSLKLRGY